MTKPVFSIIFFSISVASLCWAVGAFAGVNGAVDTNDIIAAVVIGCIFFVALASQGDLNDS